MSERTYTIDEVTQLLNTVVAGIRTGDNGDDRVYSLAEVAARTGFAQRTLERDCIAGKIEHTGRGRYRGMTSRQIALLVRRHSVGGDLASAPVDDEVEAARRSTLNGAARRATKQAAA